MRSRTFATAASAAALLLTVLAGAVHADNYVRHRTGSGTILGSLGSDYIYKSDEIVGKFDGTYVRGADDAILGKIEDSYIYDKDGQILASLSGDTLTLEADGTRYEIGSDGQVKKDGNPGYVIDGYDGSQRKMVIAYLVFFTAGDDD